MMALIPLSPFSRKQEKGGPRTGCGGELRGRSARTDPQTAREQDSGPFGH